MDRGPRLIAHCALETYSVLTRLPAPHRASAIVVVEFLRTRFPQPYLRISPRGYRNFIVGLSEHGVTGAIAYDALVAATAADSGAQLITCDRRALPIYERYGVRTRVLQ